MLQKKQTKLITDIRQVVNSIMPYKSLMASQNSSNTYACPDHLALPTAGLKTPSGYIHFLYCSHDLKYVQAVAGDKLTWKTLELDSATPALLRTVLKDLHTLLLEAAEAIRVVQETHEKLCARNGIANAIASRNFTFDLKTGVKHFVEPWPSSFTK